LNIEAALNETESFLNQHNDIPPMVRSFMSEVVRQEKDVLLMAKMYHEQKFPRKPTMSPE
jgi:hypothetical protein